jgi:hypothetical protein
MLPTRLTILLLSLAALAAAPAAASAAAQVGISENNAPMFADPNFQALHVKSTRLVVAYNAITQAAKGDDEIRSRVAPYLAAAAASGITPLVAFEHARGAAEQCQHNRSLPQCKLPSAADYEANLRAFLVAFPSVSVITPWNEANHPSQPTQRNPKAAAQFTNIAAKVCAQLGRNCTILAVDVLDQADSVKAKHPTYKATTKWIKTFKKNVQVPLKLCGIHNYSDVNRFHTDGTKALMKALGCKQYWLTETGGLYDFASFWTKSTMKAGHCTTRAKCQVKAMKYLFSIVKKFKQIKKVFIYTWYGGSQPRFDAGIVQGTPGGKTTPRPAYYVVKGHT